MCYDDDASPPVFGKRRTTASGSTLTLTAADGNRFDAYLASPEAGAASGTGVLVLPDNRGLSGFYERLADRLAEQGHTALAIDYFGRTAGLGHRDRGPAFGLMENLMPHLLGLTVDGLYADFDAAIDRLHVAGGGDCHTVVSLGFCVGGRFAFQTSAPRFGLAGAIGLYGAPGPINGRPGPTQLAAGLSAPILALFGGADEGIPPADVADFGAALTAAGVPHEIVTYEGAPHGFFEMDERDFVAAQVDAWARILSFISRRV